jgi:hypothetical protein
VFTLVSGQVQVAFLACPGHHERFPMPTTRPLSLVCVSCEGDIVGSPEFHVGLAFCCAGCVVGGPCICSYDPAPADALRTTPELEERVAVRA